MKRVRFAQFAAIGFGLALSHPGSASVITFLNEDIPIPTTLAGVSLNIETGDLGDAAGADAAFFLGGLAVSNDAFTSGTQATWQPVRIGTGNLDPVSNLAAGTSVGPGSTFSTGYGGSGLPAGHLGTTFVDGVPGYLGFSLDSGGSTYYGWMLVTLTENTPGGFVHEWAYDNTGSPLLAGSSVAVPEATEFALFLLGALGLAAHRRRSRKEA